MSIFLRKLSRLRLATYVIRKVVPAKLIKNTKVNIVSMFVSIKSQTKAIKNITKSKDSETYNNL